MENVLVDCGSTYISIRLHEDSKLDLIVKMRAICVVLHFSADVGWDWPKFTPVRRNDGVVAT